MLAFNAFALDRATNLYLWIARNHGTIDPITLKTTGLTLRHGIFQLIASSVLLVSRSWISGFVLGTLSRGAVFVNGTAFFLAAAFVACIEMLRGGPYLYSVDGWVLPIAFYTRTLLSLLLTGFVLMPALHGLYRSLHWTPPKLRGTILITASIVLLGVALHSPSLKPPTVLQLLLLVGYWPVGYSVKVLLSQEEAQK